MKIKIGQKVKIKNIDSYKYPSFEKYGGKKGVIEKISMIGDFPYLVRFDKEFEPNLVEFKESELEFGEYQTEIK